MATSFGAVLFELGVTLQKLAMRLMPILNEMLKEIEAGSVDGDEVGKRVVAQIGMDRKGFEKVSNETIRMFVASVVSLYKDLAK